MNASFATPPFAKQIFAKQKNIRYFAHVSLPKCETKTNHFLCIIDNFGSMSWMTGTTLRRDSCVSCCRMLRVEYRRAVGMLIPTNTSESDDDEHASTVCTWCCLLLKFHPGAMRCCCCFLCKPHRRGDLMMYVYASTAVFIESHRHVGRYFSPSWDAAREDPASVRVRDEVTTSLL